MADVLQRPVAPHRPMRGSMRESLFRWARASWDLDVGPLRWLGATMLVLGATVPHVAHNPGLPCPLRTLTGVPCPLCGTTTSVKALCTGRLHDAIAANPLGLLAVGMALLLLVRPTLRTIRVGVLPVVVIFAGSWLWELHRFHWI